MADSLLRAPVDYLTAAPWLFVVGLLLMVVAGALLMYANRGSQPLLVALVTFLAASTLFGLNLPFQLRPGSLVASRLPVALRGVKRCCRLSLTCRS